MHPSISRWLPDLSRQRLAPLLLVSLLGALGTAAAAAAQGPFTLLHSLFDPGTNAQAGARQGFSVALDGPIVVTGAPDDDVGGQNSGVVKVYDAASSALLHTLTNPSPAANDVFGWSVAVSGARVAVGAPDDSTGAAAAGSAYVYDLASATPTVPMATLNNPRPADLDGFGASVAVDGTSVVAGAPYADIPTPDRGAAYVFGVGPRLRIVPAAPGFVTISWTPADSPGFVLQYSDSLAPAHWLDAPSGAANPVTVPALNGTRYYRLFLP